MSSPLFDHRVPELLTEAVALYENRGREFGDLGDDELAAQFRAAFRAYAGDYDNPDMSRPVNEVAAEYTLRRRDAPLDLVISELASWTDIPGYERQLPVVLLAFGHILCIPALGMLLALKTADPNVSRDARQAVFRQFLGLPPDE